MIIVSKKDLEDRVRTGNYGKPTEFLAHAKEYPDGSGNYKIHTVMSHASGVASLAASFAKKFNKSQHARISGWLHDLGKFTVEFQAHIIASVIGYTGRGPTGLLINHQVDHSTSGSKCVESAAPELIPLMMGHHTGLEDRVDREARLKKMLPKWSRFFPVRTRQRVKDITVSPLVNESHPVGVRESKEHGIKFGQYYIDAPSRVCESKVDAWKYRYKTGTALCKWCVSQNNV